MTSPFIKAYNRQARFLFYYNYIIIVLQGQCPAAEGTVVAVGDGSGSRDQTSRIDLAANDSHHHHPYHHSYHRYIMYSCFTHHPYCFGSRGAAGTGRGSRTWRGGSIYNLLFKIIFYDQ